MFIAQGHVPTREEIRSSLYVRRAGVVLALVLGGFGTLDFPEFGLEVPTIIALVCWYFAGIVLCIVVSLLVIEHASGGIESAE